MYGRRAREERERRAQEEAAKAAAAAGEASGHGAVGGRSSGDTAAAAAEGLFEKHADKIEADVLFGRGKLRFKRVRKESAAAMTERRYNKTAWGSSEDEGGLWDVADLTGGVAVDEYYTREAAGVADGGGGGTRFSAARFRAYIIRMNRRVKKEVLGELRRLKEGEAQQADPPAGADDGIDEGAPRSASPPPAGSAGSATPTYPPTARSASASAIVSWAESGAAGATPPQRSASSRCTLRPPPTVSETPSHSVPALSEVTERYEYEDVAERYERRVARMMEHYDVAERAEQGGRAVPRLPAIVEACGAYLDQVLRMLVERHGPEPGREGPARVDVRRRLAAYWRQVHPEEAVDETMLDEFLATNAGAVEEGILRLFLHYGEREEAVPEEAFAVLEESCGGTSDDDADGGGWESSFEEEGEREEEEEEAVAARPVVLQTLTPQTIFYARVSNYLCGLAASSPAKARHATDARYLETLGGLFEYNSDSCILKLAESGSHDFL